MSMYNQIENIGEIICQKSLITGGNKGIGLAVSRAMLEFGYEIIIVARDFDTCPLVGVEKVTCIEYDLSDVDSFTCFAKEVGNIDILINNAGYMQPKYTYNNYPKEAKRAYYECGFIYIVELMNIFSENMKKTKIWKNRKHCFNRRSNRTS